MRTQPTFVILEHKSFTSEYHKAFESLPLTTEIEQEKFREELFTIQGAIEEALKKKLEGG